MSELKQIVITGISSELGKILGSILADSTGVKIIGTMRRKRTKQDKFPPNIHLLDECDLTKSECCNQVAELAGQSFQGPFGFIHSVGDFWDHVPFLEYGSKKASSMFESHVTTFYNILQTLIPVMKVKGGGSSIAFSCNSVRYNYPWMASFTASKSAVDSLVRSLANEFSGDRMRFNSLVLASLKTEKVKGSKPHGDFSHFIPPEDLVPVIKFLLSPDSYLINGSTMNLFQHSAQFYHSGYFERVAR